jgi:hypothetical protein
MKGEKKSPNTQTNPCVLVGTYRSANAEWIEERSLYNLPLKAGCDPSQFARFTHVVLYCGDRAPIARKCEFARVVDSVWMGENGYRVSEKPHAEKYVLYTLAEKVTVPSLFTNPNADVFIVSTRCHEKVDADFYSRPLPKCGGVSMLNVFEKIKPYFKRWHSAFAFNPVQMELPLFQKEETKPIFGMSANGTSVVSLFSGAGGLDIGFMRAGYNIVWANDFDKNACDTYRRNLGDHIHCGSILDVDVDKIPSCDLIIGGPPCQGFSTIGKRVSSDPKKRKAHDPRRMDSDGDGLSDGWEVANNFNPLTPSGSTGEAAADTDGDGLTNLQEVQLGTNPRLADTDGDGLNDGAEVAAGTNPANGDTDGDGLDDRYETETAGLDPLRPDSDRDGMPDGWEVANDLDPTSAVGADGADGDLDGDGLSNLDEYRNNCNPRVRDTDGDGVNDNVEVANGSDPADASDCGIKPSEDKFREINFNITGDWAAWDLSIEGLGPVDRRTIHVTMGAPDAPATTTARLRKNNSYRLSMKWLNCDGHDDSSSAPWYCWQAKIDGKPTAQTFNDYSSTRKEGVANLIVGTGWIAENEDGLLTAHIHENSERGGNVAEGKTALLHVFDIEHDLLWEAGNKCNQIRNDTPKDDSSGNFDCETIMLKGKQCSFAAHRNYLYVAASSDNKIAVTERVKVDNSMRTVFNKYADRFICAAFRNGEVIEESQTPLSATDLQAALEFDGADEEVSEELQIRVGIDVDEDGKLGYGESMPLEVCKIKGNPAYATVKAISKSKYDKHLDAIDGKVYFLRDNPPNFIAPHARSFLKLFYEPRSEQQLHAKFHPTRTESFDFNAFDSLGACFAEWLTHNCGADFNDSGEATIERYIWDASTEVSKFLSQRTPFALKTSMTVDGSQCEYLTDTGRQLLQFYNNHVRYEAERLLLNSDDGAEITLPLNNRWYDTNELIRAGVFTSLSPSWVPGLTLNIGSSSNYGGYDALLVQVVTSNPAFDDFDAFGTIGRGRVLNPRYRFTIRKVVPWIGKTRFEVVNVQFGCAVEDLYDFNYEDGELPANAAALQIGYREQGQRAKGKIYVHHIDILSSYDSPFSLNNFLIP